MNQSKYINENLTSKQKFIKDFLIGSLSYFTTILICTPLQRYQMLIIQQQRNPFKSHHKTLIQILYERTEGINHLWRSHPDDLRYILSHGLLFAINDTYKKLINSYFQDEKHSKNAFIAGAFAGITHLFLNYPFLVARLKLKDPEYKKISLIENTFISQFIRIIKTEGILTLYRGFPIALLSTAIYRSIYFGGYNHFQKYLQVIPFFNNIITKIALSFIITTIAEIVSYPFEQLTPKKSRTYYNDMTEIIGKYRTMRGCLAIVFYGELFSIYDKVMTSFILDRDELNL
ncbi:unnamed protein product [Paramecium pentaurelia]|uniref:ADP/ATP translocase n=1 Tax=Paramecium pentaurelia TaxID=43138 RepID=A0A8S1WIT8_9CILI|nr:unnamed protein product [Paramecium pentaurelia]